MIKDNLMYHNVDYIEESAQGDRLYRYTKELLGVVNDGCRKMARYACNCEVRFVTDAPSVSFCVTSLLGAGHVVVYRGDFCQATYNISPGETLAVDVAGSIVTSDDFTDEFYKGNSFSKDVYRIHMHGFYCAFGGVDALGHEVRPPKPDELPGKTIFAYGSSITHGAGAMSTNLCYAQIAGRILKADVINKGVGGSCYAEPEVADTYLTNPDWDAAILEIGINVQGFMDCDEIEKRYRYFMKKAAECGKPVFAPSMYRCFGNYYKDEAKNEKYNQVDRMIRRVHSELNCPNIHFIDGEEMLPESGMLTADGIHPSTEGHFYMGTYLAGIMKKHI